MARSSANACVGCSSRWSSAYQTITILLGYAWLGWNVPFAVKFPALFAGTFLGSWFCYEAVRPTRVMRVLFGLKPRLTDWRARR